MKYKILLYGLIAALVTGCSSAYKATQTPDDVYFSPARAERSVAKQDKYEDYLSSQDDQYLRMKVRDRNRWSPIDDYEYWNDSRYMPSYSFDYYRSNWNNFYVWNNPYAWNNWASPFYYNPMFSLGYNYYGGYSPLGFGYIPYSNIYISKYPLKMSSNVSRPSLRGYSNRNYNNYNSNYNRQGLGNSIKRVFTPNENTNYSNRNINTNNNNNTYRAPERSYTPSSSGSSSGGARPSGGVSRPPR
ncbi:hypothetical protein [Segetibacter koreensis]|uniref:hypothetical protein n=1 Tax=Segetibacter koreensis TaxID=398037 RepID=UPI00037FB377|nr:hypothetical protein [Segetibacter koreensis]